MSMCFLHVRRKLVSLSGFTRPVFATALVVAFALCFFLFTAAVASAAPPQAPPLPQAPTLEGRVESLEKQIAALQATVAAGCQCSQAPAPKAAATAAPAGYRAVEQTVQVCRDGKCSLEKIVKYVPTNSGAGSFSSSPVGDFIYDPDAGSSPGPSTGGGCASGSCGGVGGTPERWHLFGHPRRR